MATDPLFDFYQKVVVATTNPSLSEINGELAAVLGRVSAENGRWSYTVCIYRTGCCWSCMEDDLITTGMLDQRETFFLGSLVRVSPRGEVL